MSHILVLSNGDIVRAKNLTEVETGLYHYEDADTGKNEAINTMDILSIENDNL